MTPIPVRNRQRRYKPLPLCLSDNEKNMPVLTVITTEENSNVNVGLFDFLERKNSRIGFFSLSIETKL